MPERSAPPEHRVIDDAVATIPSGRWVVGVSGGADSVALLVALARRRCTEDLHVAHLDHEARGAAGAADADFVAALARSLGVSTTHGRLSAFTSPPERGHEATYRAARIDFFRQVVLDQRAAGVLLAHHADDRAETALLRLLRGGEASALGGLRRDATIDGVRVHRPLIGVRRSEIERVLQAAGQPWREDETNASDRFARNRVRRFLRDNDALVEPLLALADAADALREWTREHTVALPMAFALETLADLPDPLARPAARAWLIERGCPADGVGGDVADRLIAMSRDRATPGRQDFPGAVSVRRTRGTIMAGQSSGHPEER